MRKISKYCKWFGHKWAVAYISGSIDNKRLKFIGAWCSRCFKGDDELHKSIKNIKTTYATYSEKYFDRDII